MESKLRRMLTLYNEKLRIASFHPIDHVECIRLQAQLSMLEYLLACAIEESMLQPASQGFK